MKRLLCTPAIVVLCALVAPASLFSQPQRVILSATSSLVDANKPGRVAAYVPDDPDIPPKMLGVMRASEMHYLEGSNLIKAGDSAGARIAFDAAVDLILQSEWDLATTPALAAFFRDLIQRIQRDESRYLRSDDDSGEKPEPAAVDELGKVDLIPIRVDPALKDAVEADILNSEYGIPIVVNESVLKSLNFWLIHGRELFVDGLMRSGRYKPMIERIFREESVPLDLMYVAQVESLFETNAVSRAFAKGIWQFSKGTAIRYGLKVNRYVDERADPEKSTRAAARYLKDLYAMFNDWTLVLAAYNWGEGSLQQLVDKSGVTDFWRLASLRRRMPQETKNHVPMVVASIILARNPEKYGLPLELEPPLDYERVAIAKRVNLKAVAMVLGVPVDVLRKLNPALRTSYTPPDDPDFELNVPAGMGADLAEKLAALPASDLRADPEFNGSYRVKAGDTLSSIALRYKVTVEDLQTVNGLGSPKSLRAGSLLKMPTAGPAMRPAAQPVDYKGRYQVKAGETLAAIAQRYGVSVTALQKANNIESAESLLAGSWLKVPSLPASAGSSTQPSEGRRHQVKSGETLSSIAAHYGVSVDALQKLNGIQSPRSLRVGTWLEIPAKKN
jgi:membrane-bound lytic murein transglycosylase D